MTEIKGSGGVKPKPGQARDDIMKGKGTPTSPLLGKKKSDVPGFKGQPLPAAKQKKPAAPISKSEEAKGKASASSSTKTITKTTKKTASVRVRAEKKVYTLPGQKYDPPEEREPLRIFYESLSKQIPSSEMAEFWMMEHGLLSPEKAKRACERKQRRQQQLRTGTPVKPERPESSKSSLILKSGDTKAKKRVYYSSNDDDDEIIVRHKKARS